MSYEPRPDPSGDTLLRTRDQIRTNFEVIRDRFQDNHDLYSSGEGKHTLIDLVEQTTFPATAANESWLASREFNSSTELAWRPESTGAAGDQYILSAMPIRAAAFFVGSTPGTLLGRSFNIDSIVADGSQHFIVTLSVAAPTSNYFIIGTRTDESGSTATTPLTIDYTYGSHSTSEFRMRIGTGSGVASARIYFLIFGG